MKGTPPGAADTQLLKSEAWRRLANQEPLKGLPLAKRGKRIDLSGLQLPDPTILEKRQTSLATVERFEPNGTFYNTTFENLDFTGSNLPAIHFSECEIRNCCFDQCNLQGLRLRACVIRECSFRGANLRGVVLGAAAVTGPWAGKRNSFFNDDFSGANLKETVYIAAAFNHCDFSNAFLQKITFGTSTFENCRFEGELREVWFWRSDWFTRGYPENTFPPNAMLNVDFSRARLRDVQFCNLTLADVKLPSDDEHIVLNDFPDVLDMLLEALTRQRDQTSKILTAYLGAYRRWAVPGARGVLNRRDLAEIEPEADERLVQLLNQSRATLN